MPILHIKTFLVMAHLFGLTLGVGGATIIDVIFLRLVVRGINIKQTQANFVRVISKLVTLALVVLWLSGIGFEIQYWFISPELIPNPKVYAKLTIVVILTINGFVLHHRVLPLFYQRVGRPLLDDLRSKSQVLMIACGTISMFSWYTPFFLGVAREMNFVVPAWWILSAYAALVLGTTSMALLLGPTLLRFTAQRREAAQIPSADIAAAEIPSLEIPVLEMPARKAPALKIPAREAPAWENPSREPAWAFSDNLVSRPQPSPSVRERASVAEDEAPLILVRSWPAPASRSVSTFRPSAQPVDSAA
jgi:uncharacterized membrane protein